MRVTGTMTRREMLVQLGRIAAAVAVGGCAPSARSGVADAAEGRLALRELSTPSAPGPAGANPLGIGGIRDGMVVAPRELRAGERYPLVLLLHGAGGTGARIATRFDGFVDELRFILLVPDSRGATWDFIRGPFGPDVGFIGRALEQTRERYPIDRARIGVAGFSDGASYALSLGLTNGDLFSRVAAFSPGLAGVVAAHGHPAIFVSHGTQDQVLPIDRTSRRIVSQLRSQGYSVEYHEFEGGHAVPPEIARQGMAWLTAPVTR